ncbi:MAG TPA: right-handed parallel beta-helix repeat-containing protein [Polyangia bacterium]|jgi:hypothetical protein
MAARVLRSAGVIILLALTSSACRTYQNATDYCDQKTPCSVGKCNSTTKLCEIVDAGLEPIMKGDAQTDVVDLADRADTDGALVDVPLVDAADAEVAAPCAGDNACTNNANGPACDKGTCVPCTNSYCSTNSPSTPVCDNKKCVTCTADLHDQCKDTTPVCDNNQCVACSNVNKAQCTGTKPVCDGQDFCRGCNGDNECPVANPGCLLTGANAGACVACTKSDHCKTAPGGHVCDTKSNQCVECVVDMDCGADKPICDGDKCRICKTDKDCADGYGMLPGLCLDSGRCAGAGDVLYVNQDTQHPCSTTGPLGNVRCVVQTVVDTAIADQKAAVLLVGTTPFDGFQVSTNNAILVVAGRLGAKIVPVMATAPGASLTATGATLTIENLEIANGGTVGVSATAGTLNVRRSLIHDNMGSGISVAGAAFNIENTVIASNGGGLYAGVTLGHTTSMPMRFAFNTVVSNMLVGVACGTDAYNIEGSIVAGSSAALSANCIPKDPCTGTCSTSINLFALTSNGYRLDASSPATCKDAVTDDAPATDRKGTPRPQGLKSDCGADELMQ